MLRNGSILSKIRNDQIRISQNGLLQNHSRISLNILTSDGSKTENPLLNEVCGRQLNGKGNEQYSKMYSVVSISIGSEDMGYFHMDGLTLMSYLQFRPNCSIIQCLPKNLLIRFVEFLRSSLQILLHEIFNIVFSAQAELRQMSEQLNSQKCIRKSPHLSLPSMHFMEKPWVHFL